MLQKVLEKPLEKKAGRNFGPPGTKTMIYFVDDMNMPEVDEYGTVSPHTIIRQHLDYGHWYDRNRLTLKGLKSYFLPIVETFHNFTFFKDIHNCQYVSCMNPTSGSFTVSVVDIVDYRSYFNILLIMVSVGEKFIIFSSCSRSILAYKDILQFSRYVSLDRKHLRRFIRRYYHNIMQMQNRNSTLVLQK